MPDSVIAVDEFTDPVVIPADGDDVNEASIIAGFQALANRTLYAKNRGAQAVTDGEFLYTTAGVPTPRTPRYSLLAIETGIVVSGDAEYSSASGWQFGSGDAVVRVPMRLPPGCIIAGISFGFDNQASGTITGSEAVTVETKIVSHNMTSGGPNTVVGDFVTRDDTNTGIGVAAHSFSSIVAFNHTTYLEIAAGVGDGGLQHGKCFWIAVFYADPGPLNRA